MTSRAAFVRSEYRFETAKDDAVAALYPDANTLEISTNLDQASAAGMAAKILAATKTAAMAWEVVVDGAIMLSELEGAVNHYTVNFPLHSTDSRTYKLIGCDIDYFANTTTLRLRG